MKHVKIYNNGGKTFDQLPEDCQKAINSDLGIETFYVEHTDTYGGEANYCWINRFKVNARTMREALTKVKREIWYAPVPRTKVSDYGDILRADCVKSPECFFVYYFDADSHGSYSNIKEL